jgi:hypothetical protein
MRFKGFNIPSRIIEAIAVSAFVIVIVVGTWAFATMPHAEFIRKEVLKLLGGIARRCFTTSGVGPTTTHGDAEQVAFLSSIFPRSSEY